MDDFDEIMRIQRLINESTRQEIQDDRVSDLMALINSLVPFEKKIQVEELFYSAMDKGFTEKEIRTVINKFIKDGILFQPTVGYIQRR
jgi:DNA replicative helicase MCM subunit Mcm2 (Cdc46/Mcm family)